MIERRISKALDYRLKDPTSIPEGGKFHSMANDEKYYLRKVLEGDPYSNFFA